MKSFEGGKDGVYTDEWWQEAMKMAPQYLRDYVPEGEAFDFGSVQELGAEALNRMTEESTENVRAEEEQARGDLEVWLESMAGTPEEYWQKLEEQWWIDEEVPMDRYPTPKIDVLTEKAKEFLQGRRPELSEAGVMARAEMATKVALKNLAEQEANLITQTKVNRKGERKLKKGWDERLLHQAYYAMQGDLERIYDGDTAEEMVEDDLSDEEMVSWWAASEPGNAQARQEMERLQAAKVTKKEKDEGTEKVEEAEEQPIVKLKPDEVEVVKEPAPIVTMDDLASGGKPAIVETVEREPAGIVQKLWWRLTDRKPFIEQKEQALALVSVASVAKAEVADRLGVEKLEPIIERDGKEMVGQTIGVVQQAIQALEKDAGYLEDYDKKKSNLLRMLNDLLVLCLNIQVEYETAGEDIEEGKRQKALGLELDKTEVGDSETWREGELALEGLYAEGMLEREQPAEAKMERLKELQEQTVAQMRACNELLKKVFSAARYLKHEIDDIETEVEDDTVVEYPSDEALKKLQKVDR